MQQSDETQTKTKQINQNSERTQGWTTKQKILINVNPIVLMHLILPGSGRAKTITRRVV